MNQYKLSIIVPALRTPKWKALYDSAKTACKKYTWQMVFISPFDLPEELKNEDNIKLVKSYSTVPVATHRGILEADGELVFSTTDDGVFFEDSIDMAIDLWEKNEPKQYDNDGLEWTQGTTIISMAYGEGGNLMDKDKYWLAYTYPELRFPCIKPEWRMAQQFLMSRDYFIELGGYDCLSWEYQDSTVKDLIFRAQANGSQVLMSPTHVLKAEHLPGHLGDHGPIHDSQVIHDQPIFNSMYSNPHLFEDREIDINNWEQAPEIWERRFGNDPNKLPKTYEELCEMKNYKFQDK